jgi:hypothetical protein
MANSRLGNKIYIEATGSIATVPIKVAYILFTPDAANDQLILRETSNGADCLILRAATVKDTRMFDFSRKPIVFQNGIYVQTLSSGAKAVLITTSAGE